MTTEKKRREYTEMQAITRIENVLMRVSPPSARARVMGYISERLGDEAIQAQIMEEPDPRQTTVEDRIAEVAPAAAEDDDLDDV